MATGDAVQALQAALVEARATIAAQQTTIAS